MKTSEAKLKKLKFMTEVMKNNGATAGEIIQAITLESQGKAMTFAIYRFQSLYDSGKIDGFPESGMQVLVEAFGLRLNRMKPKTIFEKLLYLQKTITDEPNIEEIENAIENFMNS